MSTAPQSVLAGSLYAFTLPRELLHSLQLRASDTAGTSTEKGERPSSSYNIGGDVLSSLGCAACGVSSFPAVTDQREHFRSDWHRYNVKLRLGGEVKLVGEEEFAAMIDCKKTAFQSFLLCSLYSQEPLLYSSKRFDLWIWIVIC
jgi:hypothetical protein